jgi:ABC-type spermidine/putrescine transport system permease subunit I
MRSLVLAAVTTLICLVLAYPFAYFIATRHVPACATCCWCS